MRQFFNSRLFGDTRWRWPRLLGLLAAVVLAAQIGFLVHQNDHLRNFEVMGTDDCAMCQFGTALSVGPKADILIIPPAPVVIDVRRLPAETTPRLATRTAAFRSRAPPAPLV